VSTDIPVIRPDRDWNGPEEALIDRMERPRKLSGVCGEIHGQYVDTVENAGFQRAAPVDNSPRLIVGQGSLW